MDRENKEMGDEDIVKDLKEHYHEIHMMRKMSDRNALKLGIVPEAVVAGESSAGERSQMQGLSITRWIRILLRFSLIYIISN